MVFFGNINLRCMDKKPKYPRVTFNIRFCSSEDADCPASELLLQSPECKGWQSARYCTYPQVIVLELPEVYTIRQITVLSHQYKISSRVEVDHKLQVDKEFKRLGHFSMGNNQESNFQVRELKNIPVGISCATLKLTLHKNHVNKYNVFNQVGLISVCLYGEEYQAQPSPQPLPRGSIQQSADYKSNGDKADKNTLKILQELEMQKQEAVGNQDYQRASGIKAKIDEIRKVASKLQDLEQRKKIAVEREDYDTARVLHEEIKRIKDSFDRTTGTDSYQGPEKETYKEPYREPQRQKSKLYSVETDVDADVPSFKKTTQNVSSQPAHQKKEEPIHPKKPLNVDDIPITTKNLNPYEDADEDPRGEDQALKKAEALKGETYKVCSPYFQIIDEQIMMKVMSKHHTLRKEGLEDVYSIIDNPGSADKSQLVRAVLVVVRATIEDKIPSLVCLSLELLETILKKFKPRFNDGNIALILNKLADHQGHTNEKLKLQGFETMINLPNYEMTNKGVCIEALAHPEGKKAPNNVARRLDALAKIVEGFGAESYLEDCVVFAIKNIEDKSSEVRRGAVELIKALINEVGYQKVSGHLKHLKPAVLKLIEDSSEREEIPSNRQEIPLQRKTQSKKFEEEPPAQKAKPKARQEQPSQDQCPYCEKRDPQFANEDFRDIHLYNTCPMLMLCECQQAIEVSGLTAHMISECKNSKYFKRCPRCKEAVHQGKYKAHAEAKDCNQAKPLAVNNRCPLCHEDIPPGVGGWKQHLVDAGCPNHQR